MGELIFKILRSAIKAISPELRQSLVGLYESLKDTAANTETQWDDLFVEVLGVLLGIEE